MRTLKIAQVPLALAVALATLDAQPGRAAEASGAAAQEQAVKKISLQLRAEHKGVVGQLFAFAGNGQRWYSAGGNWDLRGCLKSPGCQAA